MSLLTRDDLIQAYRTVSPDKEWALGGLDDAEVFARAIEQAVLHKLATVSVEPAVWCDDYGTFFCFNADIASKKGASIPLYSKQELAAARVQAIEEAAKVAESFTETARNWPDASEGCTEETKFLRGIGEAMNTIPNAIRALIGGSNE